MTLVGWCFVGGKKGDRGEGDILESVPFCAPILSPLVRRDLLAMERLEAKRGKPVYRTTERFLDLYNLESLEDLPQVERE